MYKIVLSEVIKDNYTYIPNQTAATQSANKMAKSGDLIIIIDRGYEATYTVKGIEFDILDAEIAEKFVNEA